MRTKARFAGFRAKYLCGVAAGSLLAALGLLGTVNAANAEDGAFLPPSWFSLPTLTFDTTTRPGVDVVYKAPRSFWTENPSTRLRLEYLMLQRKGPGATALTVANSPSRFVPVSSSVVDSGNKTAPGFRATLDAELFDAPFEFSAFYSAPLRNETTLSGLSTGSGTGAIRTNTTYADANLNPNGAPFNYTNSQTINNLYLNHSSQLFGAEANAKSVFGIPGLLLGVRSIYVGDELSSVTTKFNSTTAIDAVTVQSRNFLLGPQIGFEGMFDIGGGIKIGGSAKVGLFANMVERERSYISRNQTRTRALQNFTNDTVFAQGYELNPRIEVPLMQGVKLTAGGTFLWLNNVSTAFPQYATVTDASDRNMRAKDRVFYYGLQAGVSVDLDTLGKFSPPPMRKRYLEAKMLESQGATPFPFMLYGEINRMALSWDDGSQKATRVVDNYSAPSIFGARGAAEIARGWTTGFHVEAGLLQARSIAVSQDLPGGEKGWEPDLRYLDWFIRSNRYGTLTVGHTSTATDGVVLNDFSGTNAAASANIAMIGGDLMLRAADDLDLGNSGSLITRTSIGDFVGGATIDTLRRNVVHYETPTIKGFSFDVAAREKFWDASLNYRVNLPSWRFRAGVGYLRDTEGTRENLGFKKDRREWKGSASLLHTPTGLFVTTAFVNRQFRGSDSSNQATFGENRVDVFGDVIPGTHRPDLRYGYLKTGLRRQFNELGDTKFYAEAAIAKNGLTGLREGGPALVTASQLNLVGAGVMQDLDAYNMQVYLGYRHYSFNIEGLRDSSLPGGAISSPAPIKDINLVFSGVRIKF